MFQYFVWAHAGNDTIAFLFCGELICKDKLLVTDTRTSSIVTCYAHDGQNERNIIIWLYKIILKAY